MVGKYGPLIGAVDQGTSSSRFLVREIMKIHMRTKKRNLIILLSFLRFSQRNERN